MKNIVATIQPSIVQVAVTLFNASSTGYFHAFNLSVRSASQINTEIDNTNLDADSSDSKVKLDQGLATIHYNVFSNRNGDRNNINNVLIVIITSEPNDNYIGILNDIFDRPSHNQDPVHVIVVPVRDPNTSTPIQESTLTTLRTLQLVNVFTVANFGSLPDLATNNQAFQNAYCTGIPIVNPVPAETTTAKPTPSPVTPPVVPPAGLCTYQTTYTNMHLATTSNNFVVLLLYIPI